MTGKTHEHFAAEEVALPSDRSTGLVFAAVAAIVAVLWRSQMTVLVVAAALSVAFLALSLLAPAVLRPLNKVWFKFALLLNKIVSPVVMFILFALVIVPFGLIMQMRSDPLRKRRRADLASYWVDKRKGEQAGSMTQQF